MDLQEDDATVSERLKWTVGSVCQIYSRSDKQWHEGHIKDIIFDESKTEHSKDTKNEWLIVKYSNNKKTKRIQRYCKDIKPLPVSANFALEKGSKCCIYSHVVNNWVKGEVIKVDKDEEGEWLTIKYWFVIHTHIHIISSHQ